MTVMINEVVLLIHENQPLTDSQFLSKLQNSFSPVTCIQDNQPPFNFIMHEEDSIFYIVVDRAHKTAWREQH